MTKGRPGLRTVYVDADGCPVKDDVYRVAERYQFSVILVANMPLAAPGRSFVKSVVVKGSFNAADDWIAEQCGLGDVVITADIPLADRCLSQSARVLGTTGYEFTNRSIGGALASRDLMKSLRDQGEITGGPRPFQKTDRSRFRGKLDEIIQQLHRKNPPEDSGGDGVE